MNVSNWALLLVAASCILAALLHFACIVWGSEGYRFLGAGEEVVKAVASGDWRPHISAVVVGSLLLVGAAYALSGAGFIAGLPFLRPVLFTFAGVFLMRAVAFPLLRPMFAGNSELFWVVSSAIVGILGFMFLLGAVLMDEA